MMQSLFPKERLFVEVDSQSSGSGGLRSESDKYFLVTIW